MKKAIWIIGGICFLLGIGLLAVGGYLYSGQMEYETVRKTISGEIQSVAIDCASQDVRILPSENAQCYVIYGDAEGVEYTIELTEGVLQIRADGEIWHKNLAGIFGRDPGVTLLLPPQYFHGPYGLLEVSTAAGDICIEEGLSFARGELSSTSGDICFRANVQGNLDLRTTSGDIELQDSAATYLPYLVNLSASSGTITVKEQNAFSISAKTSSGDVTLEKVRATDTITVSCTSGDIDLLDVDAGRYSLRTVSGDIAAGMRRAMDFRCDTTSGSIETPVAMADAGLCRLSTVSGDIEVWICTDNYTGQ